MSNIFISHSSSDNEFAQKVVHFLNEIGHKSFFLDFDPVNGIPAGRNWERELYSNLRKCKLAIALLSENFSSSRWCFAEIAQVRAMGKDVIPIKIAPCKTDAILSDTQIVDATGDFMEAFKRLENGLLKAGVEKEQWSQQRPPYPGLSAFDEIDAPVFFGRENETDHLLDSLTTYRRHGGEKLLLVLGASGSGKSSLIRAGLIPQLRKEKNAWLIVGPLRPSKQPFEELSKCLATSFQSFSETRAEKEIYDLLITDSKTNDSANTKLATLLGELITLSKQEITVILYIDQFEELFTYADQGTWKEDTRGLFLFYLRRFLESADNRFLVLATLRSDFLKNFQENEHTRMVRFDDYIVPFISQHGLKASITEPAKIAGVELEEGLADIMLKDTGTSDALPLLAFTLEQLWKKYSKNGILRIDDYKIGLGGLGGSVAREAEAILIGHIAETRRGETAKREGGEKEAKLDSLDENNLKAAFMAMVRIDEEGRYTRRTAYIKELPLLISGLLQRFVSHRLLITSGDEKDQKIEVAHEVLFRTWTRLANWLEQDKGFLIWRKRLNIALEEWKRSGKHDSELLRGPALNEAMGRLHEHLVGKYVLVADEIEFIKAAETKYEEERIKEELRKIELEEKNKQLELALKEAKAKTLAAVARQVTNKNKTLAMRIAEAACKTTASVTKEAQAAFVDILKDQPALYVQSYFHPDGVKAIAFAPDGQKILTGCNDNIARLWGIKGELITEYVGHTSTVSGVAFSPDGDFVFTGGFDGMAMIWSLDGTQGVQLKGHTASIMSITASPDGRSFVTGGTDNQALLWKFEEQTCIPLHADQIYVFSVAFSPDGQTVLTGSIKDICFWSLNGELKFSFKIEGTPHCLVYSRDGESLAAAIDNRIQLFNNQGNCIQEFIGHTNTVNAVCFSPDGKLLVSASDDNTLRLWDLQGNTLQIFKGHMDRVEAVAFSPDGKAILSGSLDKTVNLWDVELSVQPVLKGHSNKIDFISFTKNNSILTANLHASYVDDKQDRAFLLWDSMGDYEVLHKKNEGGLHATYNLKTDKLTSSHYSLPNLTITDDFHDKPVVLDVVRFGGAYSVNFSPSGELILIVYGDAVFLYNRLGEIICRYSFYDNDTRNNAVISSAVFSPDEKTIFMGTLHEAHLWDFKGNSLQVFNTPDVDYSDAVFSLRGDCIFTFGNRSAYKSDLKGRLLKTFYDHEFGYGTIKFLPINDLLLITRTNNTAQLWDSEGRVLQIFEGHSGQIASLDVSPDCSLVVTGSEDKTARIWRPYWEMIKPEKTYVPTLDQMKEFDIPENIEWGKIW